MRPDANIFDFCSKSSVAPEVNHLGSEVFLQLISGTPGICSLHKAGKFRGIAHYAYLHADGQQRPLFPYKGWRLGPESREEADHDAAWPL